jgi:uncharacterized protein
MALEVRLPRRGIGPGAMLAAALLGLLAGDATRPPSQQLATRAAIDGIDVYRATVSPILARTHLVVCRYEPTCSLYGREAIARYGFPKGFLLAADRIVRCNPFARGGEDPVP